MLYGLIIAAVLATLYFIWLRPLLRQNPTLKHLYDREESIAAALVLKVRGLKQKLLGALVVTASVAVTIADFLGPVLGMVDTTPLTASIPPMAWPIIMIAVVSLLQYFRKLAEKRDDL
jgi:hypothetical protein